MPQDFTEVRVQTNTIEVRSRKVDFDDNGNPLPVVTVTKFYSRKNDLIHFVDYLVEDDLAQSALDMMYKDTVLARFVENPPSGELVMLNGETRLDAIRDFVVNQMFRD